MEDDKLPTELARLPVQEIYHPVKDNQLAPQGSRIPQTALPPGLQWVSVAERFQPVLEQRSLPASAGSIQPPLLHMIRGENVAEPNVLHLPHERFASWVARAPEIRLAPLQFACSAHPDTLVRGRPLPSLPGQRYVESEGVAALAGWIWDPPLPATSLARALELRPGDLALLKPGPETAILRIAANHFVPVTRAAVRQSPTEPPEVDEP